MLYTRRDVGKIALASVPAARLMAAAKPNSLFGGVQIGAITYSFRGLPATAEDTLKYCLQCGISAIELMSGPADSFAGAPAGGRGGGMPGGGMPRGGMPGGGMAGGARAAAPGGAPG